MSVEFSNEDVVVLRAAIVEYRQKERAENFNRIAKDLDKLLHNTNIKFSYDYKQPSKQLHPTEKNYPLQTARFREILDEMYQVHLDKNRDYSPMNINATGIVGLTTRIWDKTARICNLLGFNLQTGEYSTERKSINDESIEDNLKDLSVYSIIARIYREGKWGK